MDGDITISIDKEKFDKDKIWDGLKGYITNCELKPEVIIRKLQKIMAY